jgi:hypothetical protein
VTKLDWVNQGQGRVAQIATFYLMGLIHGHWDVEAEAMSHVQDGSGKTGAESVNMGMAIVIPATKIAETLDHPELLQQRTNQEAAVEASSPTGGTS